MDRKKISIKPRKFSKNTQPIARDLKLKEGVLLRESNPTAELLNEELIGKAIWECLKEGDSEGVIEVIKIYLDAANKSQLAKETSLARSTVYHTLKSKNPTVKTLARLVHACI